MSVMTTDVLADYSNLPSWQQPRCDYRRPDGSWNGARILADRGMVLDIAPDGGEYRELTWRRDECRFAQATPSDASIENEFGVCPWQ